MKWNASGSKPTIRSVLLPIVMLTSICELGLAEDIPLGWQTYRSPDYGFSLSYPSDFKVYAGTPSYEEAQHSMIPICERETVACFEYSGGAYKGTRLQAAGVAVNVLRAARTEQQCAAIDTGSYPVRKTRIGGLRFYFGETGGAAGGTAIGGPVYRTFHEGTCFELAALFVTDNTEHEPGEVRKLDAVKLEKQLDRIVHTIRFSGRRPSSGPASDPSRAACLPFAIRRFQI
jgi:hypothetical protein